MTRGRWLTPDITGDPMVARCFLIPPELLPIFMGALQVAELPGMFEEVGTWTPDDIAAKFAEIIELENCDQGGNMIPSPYTLISNTADNVPAVSYLVPGGVLGTTGRIRQSASLLFRKTQGADQSVTIFVGFRPTTIPITTAITIPQHASARVLATVDWDVVNCGVDNVQLAAIRVAYKTLESTGVIGASTIRAVWANMAIDTSIDRELEVRIQFSVASQFLICEASGETSY